MRNHENAGMDKNSRLFRLDVDKKLILLLVLFYSVYEIIAISKTLLINKFNTQAERTFYIGVFFVDWFVVIVFMIGVAMITRKLMMKKVRLWKLVLIHLFFSVLIGFLIIMANYVIYKSLGMIPENLDNIQQIVYRTLSVSDDNFLVYFAMLSIIYSYTYFKNFGIYKMQQANLQSQLVETKMSLLKSQLDPHFIFNTLNNISSLLEENTEQAQKTIANLSGLLRDIIKTKTSNLISLQEELIILDKYIDLVLNRFSEDVSIEKDIESSLCEILVPNLMIQAIIENSIKHGFSYKIKKLDIKLSISSGKRGLTIKVINNGKPLEGSFMQLLAKGSGLKNIVERLEAIYGSEEYRFSIKNNKGPGVTTKIVIPMYTVDPLFRN